MDSHLLFLSSPANYSTRDKRTTDRNRRPALGPTLSNEGGPPTWRPGRSQKNNNIPACEALSHRIWMRTAKRHLVWHILSTLCHECCFWIPCLPHNRGFYERAAVLYHHVRGTPPSAETIPTTIGVPILGSLKG